MRGLGLHFRQYAIDRESWSYVRSGTLHRVERALAIAAPHATDEEWQELICILQDRLTAPRETLTGRTGVPGE